jgi:general secretion pathway protein M
MKTDSTSAGAKGLPFAALTETWQGFWQQRDARERRMLTVGASVVAAALAYSVLFNPAWTGRAQLQKSIPQLRQQVAKMDAMSKQSAQLNNALAENIAPVTREVIEASLTRRSVKAQVLAVNDDIVRLQLNSIAYSSLMEWLLEEQKVMRLTVEEAHITGLPEAGMVSVSLTLKQQRNAS